MAKKSTDEERLERWRRKGLDLRYGPQWYLHYDGRPPIDDDRDYVWNSLARCWEVVWADDGEDGDIDEEAMEEYEEQRRERIAKESEF